ncbi:hypothetical protein [Winogradskyella pulchriflava]|uniref:Uncharacterized protein n=1 Tax=Winogradskyella pulchriflava TaxID=1110688 RepID=A0ABV6QCA2_9FLAO
MTPKQKITNTTATKLMLGTAQCLVQHQQSQVSNQIDNVGFGDHRYNIKITVSVSKIQD